MEVHLPPISAHSISAREGSDCAGWLSILPSANTQYEGNIWFVLSGSLLFYFENNQSTEPLGMILVSSCEARMISPGSFMLDKENNDIGGALTNCFELRCSDDWSITLQASSSEELLHWAVSLSVVCKETMSDLFLGNRGAATLSLKEISSIRGPELTMALQGTPSEDDRKMMSRIGKRGTRKRSSIVKFSSSLDKMYDFEVNWRKLKLSENGDQRKKKTLSSRLFSTKKEKNENKSSLDKIPEENESDIIASHVDFSQSNPLLEKSLVELLDQKIQPEPDDIELSELLKDSPLFHNKMNAIDEKLVLINNKVNNLFKVIQSYLRSSDDLVNNGQALINGLETFVEVITPDESILADYSKIFEKLKKTLHEMLIYQTVLTEQLQSSFLKSLKNYFSDELDAARQTKKSWDQARNRYASKLQKYLAMNDKNNTTMEKQLANLKERADSFAYDCFSKYKSFENEQHLVFLEHLFFYIYLHLSYYHHGYHSLHSQEGSIKDLRLKLQSLRQEFSILKDNTETRYHELREEIGQGQFNLEEMLTTTASHGTELKKEGYLLRVSTKSGFKRWKRRWFVLENGTMYYRRHANASQTKGHISLLLTTVREPREIKRKFTFEIICAKPSVRHLVQAETEIEKREWIHAIQTMTANLLGISGPGEDENDDDEESNINEVKGMSLIQSCGSKCAECRSGTPEWASINLGITLCLDCVGAHRSVGTHITKARSLAMDKWPPALLLYMNSIGNEANASIYESTLSEEDEAKYRPQRSSDGKKRTEWVKLKYDIKNWIEPYELDDEGLAKSVDYYCATDDVRNVLFFIAHGANLDWQNPDNYYRTALHRACELGFIEVSYCIILNGGQLDIKDSFGSTPLHLAVQHGYPEIVELLIEKKADPTIRDNLARTPKEIAIARNHEGPIMDALDSVLSKYKSDYDDATPRLTESIFNPEDALAFKPPPPPGKKKHDVEHTEEKFQAPPLMSNSSILSNDWDSDTDDDDHK